MRSRPGETDTPGGASSGSVMRISADKLHVIGYETAADGAERKTMEITATRKGT